MLAYYVIGGVALIVPLGPSVLQAFGTSTSSKWPDLAITSVVIVVMLGIAVAGIRPTARTQIGMAVVEYAILVGLAVAGFVFVAGHHPGTVHLSWAWLHPTGIGGRGSLADGFLVSAFVIAGWDGTMYVNEEVKHRRTNPGRAAMWAAGLGCSPSSTPSCRSACRAWCRRRGCRPIPRRCSCTPPSRSAVLDGARSWRRRWPCR